MVQHRHPRITPRMTAVSLQLPRQMLQERVSGEHRHFLTVQMDTIPNMAGMALTPAVANAVVGVVVLEQASQTGHQFNNGHLPPMHASSTLPLGPRSPTTFNPENGFFSTPPGKHGRNGHRSQSVANDSFRFQPYQNGSPVPPVQTYNMYEYGGMQPMSAVPYSPYVDQFALFAMITTQVYVHLSAT